jgi:hypothetical protein
MSRPNNTSAGKRQIRFDAHNRKPGRAAFWKHTRERKGRRWFNRLNKLRVEGKAAPLLPDNSVPALKPIRPSTPRKVWSSTIEDFLTEDQIEKLKKIHD